MIQIRREDVTGGPHGVSESSLYYTNLFLRAVQGEGGCPQSLAALKNGASNTSMPIAPHIQKALDELGL